MSEPIQIIMGANQPSEIWQGINKDEATIQRFETVMKLFGLSDEEIAKIKGEQKPIHTHDIEVFGAPCDCGTRHEYCGECDWVEPCEQEGEQR